MIRKKSYYLKKVIIVILILAPILTYMNYYKFDESDLAYSLGKHLDQTISIIDKQERSEGKYLVVYFDMEDRYGLALLPYMLG
ncbi:hypothetical protein EZV73_10275 [Acidaminobacter sp. JC074]|uniref:hypothetical protein n=1 Tax=Acidaminobacter sp. JC074 TaxID=2530199 RepID=UPI001F118F78|nr:hypothetical protein [Acidaminobacter sp. JC074]MCH4887961.1 hypothetical protein [Acidaminobacter sp. JC074]